ncbi:MAG: class II aldolase/adducin family protein [Desulfovibrionaceae bacterium]|nr:class II aldolase/adducin family protein [Desulfovibrionaceae bacterium]
MASMGEEWLTRAGWSSETLQRFGLSFAVCAAAVESMAACCRDAWVTGLLRGFNGNMSLRLPAAERGSVLLVTGTGVAKGHMEPGGLALADMDGRLLCGARLSSETPMHVAIYRRRPETGCVLHVHPAHMLALSLRLGSEQARFLRMPLLESDLWLCHLGRAGAFPNGSQELADAVGEAFAPAGIRAVFMEGHGLCAVGATGMEALSVCEQLEHMAETQLLAGL